MVLFLSYLFTKAELFAVSSTLALRMAISLNSLLLLFCFSVSSNYVTAVNSDGRTLLSLVRHWTVVPPSIQPSWRASDFLPCSWVGVQCDHSNQFVVALALPGYEILGELGPEIASLKHLRSIDLSKNSFSGSIPLGLGNCDLLQHLDLSVNSFSGEIPQSLGNLQNLRYIDLHGNSLTGTIPQSLFSIPNLYTIYLNNNKLTGTIPTNVGNANNVLYLWLSGNQLTGSIPPSIGNCSVLQELYLSENNLTGTIPLELGKCESLVDLRIEENLLEGGIPSELGMLSQLQNLFLFSNYLTGVIPIGIWKIQSLENLLVHQNQLYGEIPVEVTNLTNLKNLSLHDNKFTGFIPQGLGFSSSLVHIDFSNNQFTGHIPSHLCFRNQLRELNLARNSFQGSIASDVGSCSSLTGLTLKQNNLTGIIPDFVENSSLLFMDLSNNRLSGGIPSSLGNLTNLISVDLSMNKLFGRIPPELGRLMDLQALDLSHNSLDGELPSQLSNCSKLLQLDVSDNLLNGSIPYSLRSLAELSTLSLSENGFAGDIPPFLFDFSKLSNLQLGGNILGGRIPSTIGSLGAVQNLKLLNLSSNRLTGEVPIELRRLNVLEQIDISCNNISGSLSVLGDIQSLVSVNVSHNLFSGPIPSTLLKFFASSPTSFAGNSGLVNCLPLNCTGNSNLQSLAYQSHKKMVHRKAKIAILVLGVSLPLVFLLVGYRHLQRKESELANAKVDAAEDDKFSLAAEDDKISLFNEIMEATESLNDKYVIGRGGQGTVYKATLWTGRVYAVKKYQYAGKGGGSRSMIRELDTIGRVQHVNLIRFEEFWFRDTYGLILFSYMENGSLHDVIHSEDIHQPLEWNIRYSIALGIAQGLSFLHFSCDPPILHGDIKSKNILLDSEFEPHISDFGLAMLLDSPAASKTWHAVSGTVGYIAPENLLKRKSKESDVYGYGVVLLELITKKKAIDPSFNGEQDIVSWVRSVWTGKEEIKHVVDPSLLDGFFESQVMEQEVTSVLLLALSCTQNVWCKRPSMRDVVKQLQGIRSQF